MLKKIQCKEQNSKSYGVQNPNTPVTICLYLTNKGYFFTSKRNLKENQMITIKSSLVYSKNSRVFQELLKIYEINNPN